MDEPYAILDLPSGEIIIDVSSGGAIAPDGNPDYQAYLAWVAAGNTPEPWVEPETDES